MKMVDADTLLLDVKTGCFPQSMEYTLAVDILEQMLKRAHAVDAVPVVRCEDCKHFRRNLENDTYCGCVGGLTDPEEHDFCSCGERKEG